MENNSLDYKSILKFLSIYNDDESLRSYFLRRFDHPDKMSWYDAETSYKLDFLFVDDDDNRKFWIENFSRYSYLYIYASLSQWKDVLFGEITIKKRFEEFQQYNFSKVEIEIQLFIKEYRIIPLSVTKVIGHILDVFNWKFNKIIPLFAGIEQGDLSKCNYYERYIKNLVDSNNDDIPAFIDKYIEFCIVVDKKYNDSKCLISFIKSLYGKDSEGTDLDTMLKSIHAGSWGIDTIRQILIKGDKYFPSEIIKLTIYSIYTFPYTSEEDSEKVDQSIIAKATLDRFVEDFEILTNNHQFIDIIDQLSLASYIRDKIVNDENIELLCSRETDIASLRKTTLNDIKKFQQFIIGNVINNKKSLNTNLDGTVKDFSQAKKELYSLAIKELESSKPINEKKHPLLFNDPYYLSHIKHLSEVAANCSHERYRILIMGEYQSGKTTFIDAINGKHIGAIGNGNTTSAVPIEMSYAEKSDVIPILKKKKDLIDLLSSIQKYIEDFSVEKFDLDNKEERNSLYEKLNNFRHDKKKCPNVREPGLKVLAICSLILKYYNDEKLKSIAPGLVKLEQVAMFSSFPNRIETRWYKKGGDDFSFEEAIFAFVRKFQCFIPSESLKQLNCTFVDSPGLFSNDYDTKITEEEMKEANAILYLLPYDKEAGMDTCGSLYILRNDHPNFLRKLFLVNNRSFCDHKEFYETNREVIKEMFGPEMELHKVDARLAYLGMLRDSYDNKYLSDDEERDFVISCQNATEEDEFEEDTFDNFIDAWNDSIYPYYKKRLRHCDKMPTAKDVIDRSKLSLVLKELLAFIEANMAYSIIVSEGIHKLYNEQESIRKSLILQFVKPYLVDKTNLEHEWDNRFNLASEFSNSAKPIIKKHLFEDIDLMPSLYQRLSKIAYTTVFTEDSIDLMIISICRKIYSYKWKLIRCGRNETKIMNLINPEINKLLSDFIADRIKRNWNDLLLNGQNQVCSNAFIAEIKLMEIELDSLWKDLFTNDDDFISARNIYFEVSKDTSKLAIGCSENDVKDFSTGSVSLMGPILNDIATITAGILALLTPTILSIALAVTSNPIGWAVGGAVAILGGGYYAFTGDDWMETRFIKSQAPKIKNKLNEQGLKKKLNDLIEKEMNKILKKYASELCVNNKRMNDERDVALSTPKEEKESKCFASLKEIININDYISDYVKFCNKHIDYA